MSHDEGKMKLLLEVHHFGKMKPLLVALINSTLWQVVFSLRSIERICTAYYAYYAALKADQKQNLVIQTEVFYLRSIEK